MLNLSENKLDEIDVIFFEIELTDNFNKENLSKIINKKVKETLSKYKMEDIKYLPEISKFKSILKKYGIDPTKNRISMEALLRRILKNKKFPNVFPLVDINNLLSLHLILPVCMYNKKSIEPPIKLRIGLKGEKINTLRGEFVLGNKPLLEDKNGPFGTPFIDDKRVLLSKEDKKAFGDIYLPSDCDINKYIKNAQELISEISGVLINFFRSK